MKKDLYKKLSNSCFLRNRFKANVIIAYRGFSATFNTDSCGDVRIASEDGWISSPNYPDLYPRSAECRYTIRAPTYSENILLTVTFLDTFVDAWDGDHESCDHSDYLQIYEGGISDSTPKYCGNAAPPAFLSNGNEAKVSKI